ncbi:unnamed protein product [Orchesella dallaii]|uniref:C2H2-type domain-containing protein n=1 Tax=Orchesella dallaii TaxID=48710 RepID=A0ABP1S3I7_9HEXA
MNNRIQEGGGAGPIPFKKVPGPASKTLKRKEHIEGGGFGWMSTQLTQQPTSYSAAVTGSRAKVGPACSKLSNTAFRRNVDDPPMPHLVKQEPAKQKYYSERITTTCLFCTDPVIISSLKAALKTENGDDKAGKLHQVLSYLCCYMEMNQKKLPKPNECTQIKFPFCNSCDQLLETIRKCHKIIKDAEVTITKTVSEIERVVADAEILKSSSNDASSSSAATIKQQKFFPLRSMVLEVYRNKLLFKKSLRKTSNLRNQAGLRRGKFSPMFFMRDDTHRSKFSPSSIGCSVKLEPLNSISKNTYYEKNEVENMTLDVNPMDVDARSDESEHSEEEEVIQEWNVSENETQDLQREQNDENSNSQGDSLECYPNARYDENRCTLVISNVRGYNKSLAIKQDTSTSTEDEDNNSYSNEIPITPTGTGTQKRKLLFEGVQIYRGTCPVNGADYLQCSLCPHRIPITKYYESRIVSAYVKMKIHIKNMHQKKKPPQPAPIKKVKSSTKLLPNGPKTGAKLKAFPCRICKKQFPNAKTLEDHSNNHHKVLTPTHICDICGRPVKGWYNNLLAHKFTHKNDAERKVAIALGERGASNTLLSNKVNVPLFKKKYAAKPKKCIPKPKRYITKPKKYLVSVETKVPTVNELSCGVCSRKFIRRCYLSLHMKTHDPARVSKAMARKKSKSFRRELAQTEIRKSSGATMTTDAVASGSSIQNGLMALVMPQGEVVGLDESIVEDNDVGELGDSNDDDEVQWWTDEEDRD